MAFAAIGACGGKIESGSGASSITDDAGGGDPVDDAATVGFEPFDAGDPAAGFDGRAPGFPPVADGPNDTDPACATRATLDCGCHGEDCPKPPESYLAEIVQECAASFPACGEIYADFDADGCAVALRMDNPNAGFVACATKALDEKRWLCEVIPGGNEISTYQDCTVPSH